MSIFKIIICIIIGLIGFYAFLMCHSLEELKEKATKEEKKILEKIEAIAIFLPLAFFCFVLVA